MDKKNIKYVIQIMTVLLLGICLGFFGNYMLSLPQTSHPATGLSRFDAVFDAISDAWVDTTNSEKDLETTAIKGFLHELGDPYTTYFSSDELETFTSTIDASFAGIGVSIFMQDEGAKVSTIFPNSPAKKAGMEAGDIIVAVNGTDISGMKTSQVKELIVGDEHSEVLVTCLRDNQTHVFTMQRAVVDTSVNYDVRGHVGYLDINTFGNLTEKSIEDGLKYFKEHQVDTIVIDLRDNGGGYLNSVQNSLSLFIDEGKTLFSMEEKNREPLVYKAGKSDTYHFTKGYLLVNHETASAAEVMSAALRENLGYKLVGKTTFGKGVAQTQMMLSDMNSIKYTYAKWLTPRGECINGVGLKPDIEVTALGLSDFYSVEIKDKVSVDAVGPEVLAMQSVLKGLGYPVDRVDGYFSETTKECLMTFEKDTGLTVDGVLDATDFEEMSNALVNYYNMEEHDAWYQAVLKDLG